MGTRLEILARVRQVPDILGKKDHEIAEICGVTPQQWSNYKSDGVHNNEIPSYAALALWNAFGIPMEWIYDGQTGRAPDQELREKLTLANRRAATWLAGRHGSRRGLVHRLAFLTLACAFFFHGGTGHGQAWERADGHPMVYADLEAAKAYCNLQAGTTNAKVPVTAVQALDYRSCMVAEGYTKAPEIGRFE